MPQGYERDGIGISKLAEVLLGLSFQSQLPFMMLVFGVTKTELRIPLGASIKLVVQNITAAD